jgi:hypothetical protein
VYAGFSLKQFRQPKTEVEVARDRDWAKKLIAQMGIAKYQELPYGLLFTLPMDSDAFDIWIRALNERSDLTPSHIRVERRYDSKELETAVLLNLRVTNDAIRDDYFEQYPEKLKGGVPLFKRCSVCRAPLQQVRPLKIQKTLMKKSHISLTHSFQVVLAAWIGDLFNKHKLTGFDLRPVQHYTTTIQGEPILYQLKPNSTLPPMASPPTEFEITRQCENCNGVSRFLKHTFSWGNIQYYEESDVYYSRSEVVNSMDFNHTVEFFGVLAGSHPMIIISQKVYQLFIDHNVKDWSVTPVYLVD